MNPVLVDAASHIAIAVVVLASVTTLALRRPVPAPRPGGRRGPGIVAALPTWGGVLIMIVLLARGRWTLAAIALIATVVHAAISRARASAAMRSR